MKLGEYEFEQGPKPGWAPPIVLPRVQADPTYGGAVVHTSPGALADWPFPLEFDALNGDPQATILLEHSTGHTAKLMAPGAAMAWLCPLAAGQFAAISACLVHLMAYEGAAGTLSVEVWDDGGGLPGGKVGTLGLVEVAELPVKFEGQPWPPYADIEILCHIAFPVGPPGGWLVLNGASLTGTNIRMKSDPSIGDPQHAYYTPATGWDSWEHKLTGTLWQGGQHCRLAGLAAAYCYPGGPGPLEHTFWLDEDGYQRYLCRIAGFKTGTLLWSPGNEITFDGTKLDLIITEQLGEQGLAESA